MDLSSDNREATRHGLDHRYRKALVTGRENVDVARRKAAPNRIAIIHELIQPKNVAYLHFGDAPVKSLRIVTCSYYQQSQVSFYPLTANVLPYFQ